MPADRLGKLRNRDYIKVPFEISKLFLKMMRMYGKLPRVIFAVTNLVIHEDSRLLLSDGLELM
jgi:hypothetical protein